MAKLKDEAMAYKPQQMTKNIAELEYVSTDIDIEDDSFETDGDNGEKKVIKQKVAIINNERYRVPNSVLKDLKVILEDNPDMKYFKVKKSGSGLSTEYTVIPIIKVLQQQ